MLNSSLEIEVRSLGQKKKIKTRKILICTFQERIFNDEFDELMRSGTTMKVSLSPDRWKTMEVRSFSPEVRPHLTLASGVQGGEKSPCGLKEPKQTRG